MPTASIAAGDALALAQRCHDEAASAHPGLCDPAQSAAFADGPTLAPEIAAFRAIHDVSVAGGGATCPGLGGQGATFAKGDVKGKGKAKAEQDDEEDDDEIDDLDPEDEDEDDLNEDEEESGEFDVEDLDDEEEEEEEEEAEPPRKGTKGKGGGGKKAGFASFVADAWRAWTGGGKAEDVAAFREWTQEKRDDLDESDFADPKNRKFPIVTQADVDAASKLIGKADDPEAAKRGVLRLCKKKGLRPPLAWVADDKAKMSDDRAMTSLVATPPVIFTEQ